MRLHDNTVTKLAPWVGNEQDFDNAMPAEPSPFASGEDNAARRRDRFAAQLKDLLWSLAKGRSVQRSPQRIVIAGVNTAQEASVVAAGLAVTCATNGYRVLLIDANLDQPSVHHAFRVSNESGLTDLLAGSNSPHRFPQATAYANLAVIPTGPQVANYSSLLARESLFHRVQPLAPSFDYLIADCGALAASLVSRIGTGADNMVVAVKEHISPMRQLADMIHTLQSDSLPEPKVLIIE